MNVLITAASRHGSTDEVARTIAEQLMLAGVDAEFRAPDTVLALDGYRAIIVGSAVYVGQWMAPARDFVERFEAELRARPTWLFSVGPLGDPPKPADEPSEIAALVERVDARGHRLFAGSLERARLGIAERAVIRLVKAPYGDFRRWDDVRAWAKQIAATLTREPASAR
ncbi:MAG TPA: flavodoxin domain-containing protein [Candidatus Limnocylindria bacterium]|jgi:menaquinone-dependent protoporphyrinogen oxidase|nr:flavodoxin domain-containing protein [Candidatus Limnocylindria bacterium]